jgi:GNAT superfamily N-acetyltransferase
MSLQILARPFDHPDTVTMVDAIQQYYVDLYGGHDDDLTEAAEFTPPAGLFLIGYLDDEPVASGGWRERGDGSVEIKRMFVLERVRNQGLARRMLDALEDTARAAGADRIVLNTGFRQPTAMRFYEANGYVRTEDRYGHYEQVDGAYFYVKPLTD